MPGTREGGIKTRDKIVSSHGLEFYKKIGKIGGARGTTCSILYSMSTIKPIPTHPSYKVSDDGQVFGKNGKAMTPQIDNKGYCRVLLRDSSKHNSVAPKKVHRLVAEAFLPNPNNLPQVDHLDGDKSNNSVANLEWVTNAENMRRATKNGVYSNRKPPEIDIYGGQILTAIESGYYAKDLFDGTNINRKTFWKYVENGDITPGPITNLPLGRKKKYCYFDSSRRKWRVEASDGRTGKQFDTEAEAIEYANSPIAGGFAAPSTCICDLLPEPHARQRCAGKRGGLKSKRGKTKLNTQES